MIGYCDEEMRGRVGMKVGLLLISVGGIVVAATVGIKVVIVVGFTLTVGFTMIVGFTLTVGFIFIVVFTLATELIPLLAMG